MNYQNSVAFEEAVLGCHSDGSRLVERFWEERADFSADVTAFLEGSSVEHPDTRIGTLVHWGIKNELDRLGIDTRGFVSPPTVNTKLDARFWIDWLIRVPSIPKYPVTVDLFNIYPNDVLALRDFWMSTSKVTCYSEWDLQSDLFLYNRGLFAWMKEKQILGNTFVNPSLGKFRIRINKIPNNVVNASVDFRRYADRGRPENQFIFTPDMESRERRREFVKMVARYFAKVSGQNIAQQSH